MEVEEGEGERKQRGGCRQAESAGYYMYYVMKQIELLTTPPEPRILLEIRSELLGHWQATGKLERAR